MYETFLKCAAADGRITRSKSRRSLIEWDKIGLYLSIAGISCLVGWILAFLFLAYADLLKPLT